MTKRKVPTVAEVRNATTPAQAAAVREKLLNTPPPGRAIAAARNKGQQGTLKSGGKRKSH